MQLKDQVIVVTGAGSGLGAATAAHLLACGAKVAMLDLNAPNMPVGSKAQQVFTVACDVTDAQMAEAVLAQIHERLGPIRGLVNCAGVVAAQRIVGRNGPQSLDDFSRVIQINLIGTFNLLRLCAAQMTAHAPLEHSGERGVIINTASVAAFEGQIGQAAYSASKGGVVAMTLPAAREFGQFGIRVMTIAPGIMDTPMMASLSADVRETLGNSVTYPKRLGLPSEFAQLVQTIFENTYLNGSVIRLDGALRLPEK